MAEPLDLGLIRRSVYIKLDNYNVTCYDCFVQMKNRKSYYHETGTVRMGATPFFCCTLNDERKTGCSPGCILPPWN